MIVSNFLSFVNRARERIAENFEERCERLQERCRSTVESTVELISSADEDVFDSSLSVKTRVKSALVLSAFLSIVVALLASTLLIVLLGVFILWPVLAPALLICACLFAAFAYSESEGDSLIRFTATCLASVETVVLLSDVVIHAFVPQYAGADIGGISINVIIGILISLPVFFALRTAVSVLAASMRLLIPLGAGLITMLVMVSPSGAIGDLWSAVMAPQMLSVQVTAENEKIMTVYELHKLDADMYAKIAAGETEFTDEARDVIADSKEKAILRIKASANEEQHEAVITAISAFAGNDEVIRAEMKAMQSPEALEARLQTVSSPTEERLKAAFLAVSDFFKQNFNTLSKLILPDEKKRHLAGVIGAGFFAFFVVRGTRRW